MRLTADTITDEQIRALRVSIQDATGRAAKREREICDTALGRFALASKSALRNARARCAEMLNSIQPKTAARLDREIAAALGPRAIVAKLKAAGYQVRTSSRIGIRADNGAWEAVAVNSKRDPSVVSAFGATRAEALAKLAAEIGI